MNIDFIKLRAPLTQFLNDCTFNFERLTEALRFVSSEVIEFCDATTVALDRYLPDGNKANTKQYIFVKTDASANVVTIYPDGAQQILATTSFVLSTQGDSVRLVFDVQSQSWWSI